MDLAPQRPLVGRGLGAIRDLASPIELGARLGEIGPRLDKFGF